MNFKTLLFSSIAATLLLCFARSEKAFTWPDPKLIAQGMNSFVENPEHKWIATVNGDTLQISKSLVAECSGHPRQVGTRIILNWREIDTVTHIEGKDASVVKFSFSKNIESVFLSGSAQMRAVPRNQAAWLEELQRTSDAIHAQLDDLGISSRKFGTTCYNQDLMNMGSSGAIHLVLPTSVASELFPDAKRLW